MCYKVKINDERQLIVKALYDWRSELPADSLLRTHQKPIYDVMLISETISVIPHRTAGAG